MLIQIRSATNDKLNHPASVYYSMLSDGELFIEDVGDRDFGSGTGRRRVVRPSELSPCHPLGRGRLYAWPGSRVGLLFTRGVAPDDLTDLTDSLPLDSDWTLVVADLDVDRYAATAATTPLKAYDLLSAPRGNAVVYEVRAAGAPAVKCALPLSHVEAECIRQAAASLQRRAARAAARARNCN